MKDRLPRNPNRVLITPEGSPQFFATWERADNPEEVGTPLNKYTLMQDSVADKFQLGDRGTVNQALNILGEYNKFWWKRRPHVAGFYERQAPEPWEWSLIDTETSTWSGYRVNNNGTFSDSITIDSNGVVSLVDPQPYGILCFSRDGDLRDLVNAEIQSKLVGKYVKTAINTGGGAASQGILYITPDTHVNSLRYDTLRMNIIGAQKVTSYYVTDSGEWEYINDLDRNRYPDEGEVDNYEYYYIGVPLKNSIYPTKIEVVPYIGTGELTKTLAVDFKPLFICITGYHNTATYQELVAVNPTIRTSAGQSITWNNSSITISSDSDTRPFNVSTASYSALILGV